MMIGLVVTLKVTFIALFFGLGLGLILALMRVYGSRPLARLALLYSTLMRAMPLILAVLILFFVIAGLANLPAFWAGSLALSLVSAAYQSEIFRGALQSVAQGQMMAARSIGMSRLKAIRYVILPQAFQVAIPPWSNEAAIVLKDSSLVYVLGVPEMLRQAQYFSARTYQPFLAYFSVALIYFLLTFMINRGLELFDRKHMAAVDSRQLTR
jgi:polar amino acid transport system permease protein